MTRGPNATQLRMYLAKGLNQRQVVEAWEKDSGIRVSRSTIGMAMKRFGFDSPNPRPRYEDMLPWTVRKEHTMVWDARMLRLESKRRRGEPLTEKEKRVLTQWRTRLEEANAVVVYEPETEEGFFWMQRRADDDDIVRRGRVR